PCNPWSTSHVLGRGTTDDTDNTDGGVRFPCHPCHRRLTSDLFARGTTVDTDIFSSYPWYPCNPWSTSHLLGRGTTDDTDILSQHTCFPRYPWSPRTTRFQANLASLKLSSRATSKPVMLR